MTWTNPKVLQDAKRLWAKGKPASEIARRLSSKYGVKLTRNSVLGKLHREGVPRRSDEANRQSMRVGGRKAARASALARFGISATSTRPESVRLPTIAPDPEDIPRKKLNDLENHECHWPIGDPLTESFGYCADKVLAPTQYCARHFRRMFQARANVSNASEREKATECIQHD